MATTPDIGTGMTVLFGTTSFSAPVLSARHTGMSRKAIQTSHMGTTTAHTFMPGDLYDPGSLELSVQLDTDAVPPITATAETVTLTFPDAETRSYSGFITDVSEVYPLEEIMTADITVKLTGAITF
jgi:hypothetical protein